MDSKKNSKRVLVFKELIKELKARDEKGWKSYGKPMTTFDGRNSLQDLKEELLDALVYIKKLELELYELYRPNAILSGDSNIHSSFRKISDVSNKNTLPSQKNRKAKRGKWTTVYKGQIEI